MPSQPRSASTGSDEAVLPTRGALRPDRSRDGTAESEDLAVLSQRAVESADDDPRPLDFEDPAEKVHEASDLDREPEAVVARDPALDDDDDDIGPATD